MGSPQRLFSRHPGEFTRQTHQFHPRQTGNEGLGLGHEPDPCPEFGPLTPQIEAEHSTLPGSRSQHAEQNFQQRRFAGPVLADQSDRAGRSLQRDVTQSRHPAIFVMDLFQFQQIHACHYGATRLSASMDNR